MGKGNGEFRLGYRPDIEGLRAVAILLVVAVHAGAKWLPGGFVGVDVFYILSGYLITGLLVQEAATSGRLGFANFYARRLRRLLPALLLMLAVTCILAKLLMPPTELPNQAANAASAALWLSNFQFAFWNIDYFSPSSDTALFLHTWSLGVEEQFYLVWPLLVVVTIGAWKYARRAPNVARLKWLFGGIFIASLALSLYWTRSSPMFAFYLMPSRAWQFALGALVFLVVGSPAFKIHSVAARSTWIRPLGWLGLAMILLAARLIQRTAPYPGTWALLPSFGAALVLAAGAHNANAGVGRLLSWRPMQALGRVSYSWYLWHWPVLLLGAAVLDMDSVRNRLLLVAVSLAIAAVSYHLFETPIRHNRKLVAKPVRAVMAALAVMLVAEVALRGWQAETKSVARSQEFAPFVAARTDQAIIYAKGCFGSYTATEVKVCTFGNPGATHTAVLLGDSKAAHWFPAYRQIYESPEWRLLAITKSACPIVDASYVALTLRREYTECANWRRDALRKVAALHPDVVVLGESITYPFSKEQWITGTQQALRALGPAKRVYLMVPTPELPFDGRLCPEPRSRLYDMLVGKSHCAANSRTKRLDDVRAWLKIAAAPFPNVHMVDMTDNVCPGGTCRSELDGRLVFSDAGHMTATFARTLAPALAKALGTNGTSITTAGDRTQDRRDAATSLHRP